MSPSGRMLLKITEANGDTRVLELGDQPLTIGRSSEADIRIHDEKASRIHCGLRLWDDAYHLRDLKSKNGTYLNGDRVEFAKLAPGDHFRVGSTQFVFESAASTGATAVLHEVEEQMSLGKGYHTILHEIVNHMEEPPAGRKKRRASSKSDTQKIDL